MINKRNPVSNTQNIWFDAQQVDNEDLSAEQTYNDTVSSAIINNHIGSGVLLESLEQPILFDSSLVAGFLDGIAIDTQNQPHDNNFGNQLEIQLTGSKCAGKKTIKLCIFGLDFNSNLQYETFVFKTNEIQIGKKHFTKILLIIFNDFIGNPATSLNLGGKIVIRESRALSISRDPIMMSQDLEPNLFFRDFFLENNLSINDFLATSLPLYNIQNLNILTTEYDSKVLSNGDITTQIGQKFPALTNNLQKITLLLSVRNLEVGNEDDLVWNGDLVLSIYPLQSSISSPFDISPNLDIEFSPSNVAIAQISVNYATLAETGVILNSVPQPVDFVFSNSPIAGSNVLSLGKYYAFTIKRSGSANKCDILVSSGSNQVEDSRITIFNGNLWVDLAEEDLWFKIWTDSIKISDGQAYEAGHGIEVPKLKNATEEDFVDYCADKINFVGNDVYKAVLFSKTEDLVSVPDQRTGEPVWSRKRFIPDIKLLSSLEISNLNETTDLFILGAVSDKNRKFYDSIYSLINSKLFSASIAQDELMIRVVDDPTDTVRFDSSVNSLISNLLNGDFVGAKIFPNANNSLVYYRIAESKLASCILGDVNGDGIIDQKDLDLLNDYIGYDFNIGLPLNSVIDTDGTSTTYTNGYNCYTKPFVNDFGLDFQLINPVTHEVVASGNDGVLVSNPSDNRLAQFTSSVFSFNTVTGLSSYKLAILNNTNDSNYGVFDIYNLDSNTDVITIKKIILNSNSIMHMFRADIDGDFAITHEDGYLLQKYIEKYPLSYSVDNSFPGPSTDPFSKIGTRFNIIKFKLEKFIDRADDYSIDPLDRFNNLHVAPELFLSDGYFESHNYYVDPVSIIIQKQLTWEDYLIVTNHKPKVLPCVFHQDFSNKSNSCNIEGVKITTYNEKPDVESGSIDLYAPNNVIIGRGGELHREDGNFYKVDFEVGTVVLEIPKGLFGSDRSINILDDFIADYTGDGRTRLGFPSMKFADCSYVSADALSKDQLRFSVSVQSISPTIDGYGDTKLGVYIDPNTGLLTLHFSGLFQDETLLTLSTKIQVHVFLKKGGFNNNPLFVDSLKMQNMLELISVFGGSIDGGPSALLDLESDVTGILPIIHGGTGLNDVGAVGTVLTSTGSGLSYQFITQMTGTIPFSTGVTDADKIPKTDGYGKLDPSFMYKNPLYVYGTAGNYSHDNVSPLVIGAFPFRFDNYILESLDSIKLEAILQTTNAANTAEIKLYNVTGGYYIDLVGSTESISTNATVPTLVTSGNIAYKMPGGEVDTIYEVHLSLNPNSGSEKAICKMARLTVTYYNPSAMPPASYSYNFVPYLPELPV